MYFQNAQANVLSGKWGVGNEGLVQVLFFEKKHKINDLNKKRQKDYLKLSL